MNRRAGVLLHPSSLPSQAGIGDLGLNARRFADWLHHAGATLWQMLPLVPPGMGDSPYAGWSALCGNRWLISLDDLVADNLLPGEALPAGEACGQLDPAVVREIKRPLLEQASLRLVQDSKHPLHAELQGYRGDRRWLEDVALYWDIRRDVQQPWWSWDDPLRKRERAALLREKEGRKDSIDLFIAQQFLFDRQLSALRKHCADRNIRIIGDIPIYVAPDSADVWANPEIFQLAEDGTPRVVAGVPPDYFSETGQLWGNPLYDWERLAETGYAWWLRRMRRAMEQADMVRIDHFRGFSAYWEIPANAEDARAGRWVKGPGRALFDCLEKELGALPVLAEDLGEIDDDVRALLRDVGFPGCRVLQFAFGGASDNTHLPHHWPECSAAYTGTHDNNTFLGWWSEAPDHVRDHVRRYLAIDGHDVLWDSIRATMASSARMAIFPMQDLLALGAEARMNTPSVSEGNWSWRMNDNVTTDELASRFRNLVEMYDRRG